MSWNKVGFFALGSLFGSAGIKVLSSRDAKKVYTHCTAATLRAKDAVLDQVTKLQENCSDIYADAKAINEERRVKDAEAVIEEAYTEEKAETEEGAVTEAAVAEA